jgi:hypothetical protein
MSSLVKLVTRHGGDDEAMSMGDNMSSGTTANEMTNEFHASTKDTLWISPFVPTSSGAMLGACVLLLFIAALTCFTAALQRSLTIKWAKQASRRTQNLGSTTDVPFILSNDVQRGLLHMVHLGLLYLLMLAVM